jgi:hypothetical protein
MRTFRSGTDLLLAENAQVGCRQYDLARARFGARCWHATSAQLSNIAVSTRRVNAPLLFGCSPPTRRLHACQATAGDQGNVPSTRPVHHALGGGQPPPRNLLLPMPRGKLRRSGLGSPGCSLRTICTAGGGALTARLRRSLTCPGLTRARICPSTRSRQSPGSRILASISLEADTPCLGPCVSLISSSSLHPQ